MIVEADRETVREVVAVFHSAEDLESAIDHLLRSGFHRAELSLLASEHTVTGKASFVVVFSTTYPAAWGYFPS
jgi:hypothetical protein